jgi:alkaline phosphatase
MSIRPFIVSLAFAALLVGCVSASNGTRSKPGAQPRARNVILFVGDGMGIATVTATRILDGQRRGGPGEDNVLSFEQFPYTALSKTYTFDYQVGESAGTITAMMSGEKTHSAVLGESAAVTPGKCEGAAAASIPTLLEQAADRGLATGVVTTTRITHATPAGTYAHTPSRDWESDATTPAEARAQGCRDIAAQLVEFSHGHGIDVMFGGGRAMFEPRETVDVAQADQRGVRTDGRNLIEQWKSGRPQRAFVWNATQLEQVPVDSKTQVLGLFSLDHMQFDADRESRAPGEPSLAAMTAKAIALLAKDPKGYFLLVEGGRIDHGHHAGNAYRALTDAIAFADAVALADRATDPKDTLIVVTADHSHTLTISGYPARGTPILGKATAPDGSLELDGSGKPYTTLGYTNGPGALEASNVQGAGTKRFPHLAQRFDPAAVERPDLTNVDTTAPDYLQEAELPMSSETHGGEDVPVYARGPGAERVHGVIEQNRIYAIMKDAYAW